MLYIILMNGIFERIKLANPLILFSPHHHQLLEISTLLSAGKDF